MGRNPMSRTRLDLVKAVTRLGISETRAMKALDIFFETLRNALEGRAKVTLTGFGTWEWKQRKARMVRNPKTGEKVWMKTRRALVFRPSQQLKKRVNLKPASFS
jgi:integration host factor subunit alpha